MLRRRDRHFAFILAGMLLLQVATSALSVASCVVWRRRFRELSTTVEETCKASERASIEAAGAALALADMGAERQLDAEGYDSTPRVLGYGQTRHSHSFWIYRDVEQDGVVHREFIQRIPFD